MSNSKRWFVGYDREDKSRRLLLISEDFNLVHNYYMENKRKYRVENDIKLYIWGE